MAALAEARGFELVELRQIASHGLKSLLDEEARVWDEKLHWDFGPSAALVLQYTASGGLDGLALLASGEVAGYCYWVTEGRKALAGDLYVSHRWRSSEAERYLFRGMLSELNALPADIDPALVPQIRRAGHFSSWRSPWITRIEAQILLAGTRSGELSDPDWRIRIYPRLFMMAPLGGAREERATLLAADLRYERWSMQWMDNAASLIATTYAGHIDSEINDQYRSVDGARRFIQNVVQFPGCGAFQHECSWIAFTPNGDAAGLVAATRLSPSSGHIAQICVHPAWQGAGVGAELMRRAMEGLHAAGMREASLTVTEANPRAITLYERFGFQPVHRFDASVWDKTQA